MLQYIFIRIANGIANSFCRHVHSPCCHTDRMTERSVLHLVSKQPLAECCAGWESLWASTTCSISHILSHLRGTYLIRSSTQLLRNTFNSHQTWHSRGAREPRKARQLPWPLSLSRFPRMEEDMESYLIGCCTVLTN